MSAKARGIYLLVALLIVNFGLAVLTIEKISPPDIESPSLVRFEDPATVVLDSLTLRQKIAQMIVVYGSEDSRELYQNLLIGGIYLTAKDSKEEFVSIIDNFQQGAVIPFFVSADLEGCMNPFENFQEFPSSKDIETKEQAYDVGYQHGKLLRELGFNINFAPVVDLQDSIWNCRSFSGTPGEIAEKADFYIRGLEDNGIISVSKHYPGKALSVKDPHKHITYAEVTDDDLVPFRHTMKRNVSAVMVSHIIVKGSLDSQSKPSVVSQDLISGLRKDFGGIIITDEINMLGLKEYYTTLDELYLDIFKADNDLVLNFNGDTVELVRMISVIEEAVKRGEISEERINRSVIRILHAKGISVAG